MSIKLVNKLGTLLGMCSIATFAYATGTGFYVGTDLGQTNTHNVLRPVQTNQVPPTTVNIKPSNTGFGGRVFMGYSINQFVAIESGFTHYAPSTYNIPSNISASCGSPTIRENGVDVVGKGSYPIANMALFGKAGVAVVRTSLAGSMSPLESLNSCGNSNGSTNYVRPTAALGFSYDLTPNWVADVTYSRVFKSGNFQNADLIGLGISYHFVDKYCGQFLC